MTEKFKSKTFVSSRKCGVVKMESFKRWSYPTVVHAGRIACIDSLIDEHNMRGNL